jgi:hypothetical protein
MAPPFLPNMRRQSAELLADHEGLELHGAPVSAASRGSERKRRKFPEPQAMN